MHKGYYKHQELFIYGENFPRKHFCMRGHFCIKKPLREGSFLKMNKIKKKLIDLKKSDRG